MIRPLTCPICKKPVAAAPSGESQLLPFCSERCRQVDLLRWCQGKYAVVEPLSPEQLAERLEATLPGDDEAG